MQIGIIYSSDKKILEKMAQGLKRGLEEQGLTVILFADDAPNFRGLAMCKYLMIGSYKTAVFKPKTPQRLRDALNKIPGMAGKKSIAFMPRGGMGERKALLAVMNDMEKQGCYVVDQHSFSSEKEAYEFAKNIKLK